ncbi:hypothetical protein JW859_04195 [bacterium]|nr:hypothetical protein [bacterium]
MGEKTKSCPQCNGTLTYRLGQYACDQCDYTEEALPETPASQPGSGPGFQRPQQWSRPPAAPSGYGEAPPAPGTLYGAGRSGNALADRDNPVQPIGAAEYMLVGCLGFFIPIVGVGFAHYWQGKGRPGAESCVGLAWGWLVLNVIAFFLILAFGPRA